MGFDDVLRRSLRAAGEGLHDDPGRTPAVLARVVRHRRRRNASMVFCLAALTGAMAVMRVPVGANDREQAIGGDYAHVIGGPPPMPSATCDEGGLRSTGTIDAFLDGATLVFRNERADDVTWYSGRSTGIVAAGESAYVTLLDAPGVVRLTCETASEGSFTTSLRITDSDRFYVSEALSCRPLEGTTTEQQSAAAVLPPGFEEEPEYGDPLALTLRRVTTTGADVVERAGYPDAPGRSYRVRRGDQVWATVRWVPAPAQRSDGTPVHPNGGWFARHEDRCEPR